MFYIPKRWDDWVRAVVAAGIGGFSSSVLAVLGIAGANSVGIPVHTIDWKQMIDIGLSGAAINVLMYLKQTPLPPPPTGNTEFLSKQSSQPDKSQNP